jgi:hypothetical protein
MQILAFLALIASLVRTLIQGANGAWTLWGHFKKIFFESCGVSLQAIS